ncbi:hypothetical protein [Leucobacter manosquensis]|uniref:Uncharacterized protein n=1 Tax=Leucobacter manosquensis TaxID=2810611 RepID=A0ABS5M5B5_9MICO|nr:hypothetical protein [Leucobacter manosquensis]MBS3182397.1 hypothetical protein [Leucobacter manosquensis]
MVGEHDRQESEAQTRLATQAIQFARSLFNKLPSDLPTPEIGSMLHLEREYTKRGSTDTLVMTHRARAHENLSRIFDTMIDEEGGRLLAYPFSIYSLIRPSIEAAAVAMWLVKSSKKADRVLRALQMAYRDSSETLKFVEIIKGKNGAKSARDAKEKTLERLKELQNTVGPLRQVELGNPPTYTQILTSVSPKPRGSATGYGISSPLVIWKASSAFLHGSDETVRALSDIRQIDDFEEGVASFEITPNMQMLAVSIRAVVDLLSELDERYLFLATHDHRHRPVGGSK